jgi:hypothetical protein
MARSVQTEYLIFVFIVIIFIGREGCRIVFFFLFTEIEKFTILAVEIVTSDHIFTGSVNIQGNGFFVAQIIMVVMAIHTTAG